MGRIITIFTDGGSRGNPGPAASGVVIYAEDKTVLKQIGVKLGITTNNVAEYTAILEGLLWVKANRASLGEISVINFFMDSLLARQQLTGNFKINKPHLISIFRKIQELERELGVEVTYTHVPREQNKEADAMVNRALDNLL